MKERESKRLPPTLRSRMRSLVMVVLIAALMPTALVGWSQLYSSHLEITKPIIEVLEAPRGIGLTPVRVIFKVQDADSGLSRVETEFVRSNDVARSLLDRDMKGKVGERFTLEFSGDGSELEEGPGTLRIKASDQSFWGNTSVYEIPLHVDFHKPSIRFISQSSSVSVGHTSFALYEAADQDLVISGIKAGNRVFQGFSARGFDKEITDSNLYGVFYSLEDSNSSAKLFAEDQVGNTSAVDIQPSNIHLNAQSFSREITGDDLVNMVQSLVESELGRFEQIAAGSHQLLSAEGKDIETRTADRFKFLVDYRTALDNQSVAAEISKIQRFDRYWEDFFSRPTGNIVANFGAVISYTRNNKTLARLTTPWIEISPSGAEGEVRALNEGYVAFVGQQGVYGNIVVIDHGLGVATLYGGLAASTVQHGALVHRNQIIGTAQGGGLLERGNFLLEMRLQGVRVDPSEWWNGSWYQSEFIQQIDALRRVKGLPIYRPLGK